MDKTHKNYKAHKNCQLARVAVIDALPQLAPLILSLPFQVVENFPTMFVTDKGVVGVGREFAEKTPVSDLAFGFVHEGWHILLEHFARREARDPKIYNIAGDIVINEMTRRAVKGQRGISCPAWACWPEAYGLPFKDEGLIWTTNQVYDHLVAGGMKASAKDPACGSGAGNAVDAESEITIEGSAGAGKDVVETIRENIGRIAGHMKSIGAGSAELDMWADAVIGKPKYDPMRELRASAQRVIESIKGRISEENWNKINRRGFPWIPGRRHFAPSLDVVVDSSGSMTGDGNLVLTEIAGLLLKLGKVYVVTNDTTVTFNGYVKTPRDFLVAAKGGGGTDLAPAFEHLREAGRRNPIVCITDGELSDPGAPEGTIWLVTNKTSIQPWMKRAIWLEG